jgi:hypothetical protein
LHEPSRLDVDGSNVIRLPLPGADAFLAHRSHPERPRLEAFVAGRFAAAYGAKVAADYPLIAGLAADDGEVLAAAGVRFAKDGPLFLERYLDAPVEAEVSRVLGVAARRDEVVEIGAFASRHPTWSMQLFDALPPWLAGEVRQRYAVATLRPELARLLGRAGFALRRVRPADPARLGPDAAAWGRYYAGAPQVYAGRIGGGEALALMRERLRSRAMERQARLSARASA